MIAGILIILIAGFLAGKVAGWLKLPELVGMLLAGIIVGPHLLDLLPEQIMSISEEIRILVLLIILFKAGLGLDREKLQQEGTVALRLGFLPALLETAVIAVAARYLLGWDWITAGLLGWIICAASPAVIVPMMLKLKSQGIGAEKGIPDLILAGGTLSDVFAVTMFGIFLAMATGETIINGFLLQLANIPLQIILGLLFGFLAGLLTKYLLEKTSLTSSVIQDLILALGVALLLLLGENYLPYSEFLAIMTFGFTLLEKDMVLARQLRGEVDKIWQVGEIFLFVLIGATVNISVMLSSGLVGLLIIALGLIFGRTLGIYLSTWGSSLSWQERNFVIMGQMAKATVQAAIGGLPLAAGLPQGEVILAISVLSIILTAPTGAAAIKLLAPRWLKAGKIDPTKVTVQKNYHFLVAFDNSEASRKALQEAAQIARQLNGEITLLNIQQPENSNLSINEIKEELNIASDIKNQILIKESQQTAQAIISTALQQEVDYIFLGKQQQISSQKEEIGSIAYQVSKEAKPPVVLVTP